MLVYYISSSSVAIQSRRRALDILVFKVKRIEGAGKKKEKEKEGGQERERQRDLS